jgi:SPP1 family predicted phage head-tail adaptor
VAPVVEGALVLTGVLRDRVTITRATTTTDSLGGQATSWSTLATVWGCFRGLTGREAMQASAVQSSMTHRLTIRYRSDVTVKMRATLETAGPTCDITAVRDADGRKTWLELDLVEVL